MKISRITIGYNVGYPSLFTEETISMAVTYPTNWIGAEDQYLQNVLEEKNP
jgi:hypothetical protein